MDYNVVSETDEAWEMWLRSYYGHTADSPQDETSRQPAESTPKKKVSRQYMPNNHYKWDLLRRRPKLKNRRVLSTVSTLRLMKGMTQTELAERVGVTRQTINNIEIHKTMPAVDVALAIAEVLEVDINNLFMFR